MRLATRIALAGSEDMTVDASPEITAKLTVSDSSGDNRAQTAEILTYELVVTNSGNRAQPAYNSWEHTR